jgi:dTDP-4-dehydrorhamnose reductase
MKAVKPVALAGRPSQQSTSRPLELWGGVECSLCRFGGHYSDQLARSGHAERSGDLDLFAELGLRALRQPVLWERTMPDGPASADWSWPDSRLARLHELKIQPIVGLVHHGSGPRSTSLLDPGFPDALARYAGALAERYPWVADYTPINEPLTTARFSTLYGHWYPHARDGLSFARAVLNQCRAIVLAMRAIREVNSAARLVQTDDLGKTHSTRDLAYQARFENARRWLSFDLLCGRVNPDHPLWGYLLWVGLEERDLAWFLEQPCPPDVIGINHYLTSERFLDERLERYPPHTHGGNDRQAYADVEAVRVLAEGPAGPRALLREAWRRYALPIAVTEVHLGCTREEQLRWFAEVWEDAQALRKQGVDVRAVTCWSLLGSYDWTSLLTRCDGHYEPGAFDLRGPAPRPTALAHLIRRLAAGEEPDHPVLARAGWWRRPQRLLYPPFRRQRARTSRIARRNPVTKRAARPLLIIGAGERLAEVFAGICEMRSLPTRTIVRDDALADPGVGDVERLLAEVKPWAVVHVPPYPAIDRAEDEPEACRRVHTEAAGRLARICSARSTRFLTLSSDLVFGGGRSVPFVESDDVEPLSEYGRSKAEAERLVLAALPAALIIRTGPLLGASTHGDFVERSVHALAAGRTFVAVGDQVVSPTFVPDFVHAALDLLIDGESGIWHLVNQGAVTWAELATRVAEIVGVDPAQVEARPGWSLTFRARRPAYSALDSERGRLLPPLDDSLRHYVGECLSNPVLAATLSGVARLH